MRVVGTTAAAVLAAVGAQPTSITMASTLGSKIKMGGAVINSDADVVGIIYARSRTRPGVAFATDSAELARLLRERPMDPIDRCF